jgi:hypothetical protein
MQRRAGNRAVSALVQRSQPGGGRHVAHTKTPHAAPEVSTALAAVKLLLDAPVITKAKEDTDRHIGNLTILGAGRDELARIAPDIKAYRDMAEHAAVPAAKQLVSQLGQQVGRYDPLVKSVAEGIAHGQDKRELEAARGHQAPTLARVEAATAEAASQAGIVATATDALTASRALAAFKRAVTACEERTADLEKRVAANAQNPQTLSYISSYLRSAQSALARVRSLQTTVEDLVARRRAADEAASRRAAGEAAVKELADASAALALADEAIEFEEGYAENLLEIAVMSETHADGNPDFGAFARLDLAARMARLRLDRAVAVNRLAAANLAITTAVPDTIESLRGADVTAAGRAATGVASVTGAATEATSHLADISGLRTAAEGSEGLVDELRHLAGGMQGVEELVRACGVPRARSLLTNPGATPMRTVLAGLGEAGLTALNTGLNHSFTTLLETVPPADVIALAAVPPGGVGLAGLLALQPLISSKELNTATAAAGGVGPFAVLSAALGAKPAGTLLADPKVGAKLPALWTSLGAGLATLLTSATLDRAQLLLGALTAQRVAELADPGALGPAKLAALFVSYDATELEGLVTSHGLVGLKAALASFTPAQLKASKLTKAQLDALAPTFTIGQAHQMATTWKEGELANAIGGTGFADGAALQARLGLLGNAAKVTELMVTRKLTVAALQLYSTAWLGSFVGAGNTTFNHLTDLIVKADGVISGGHDRAAFTNRTNQLWPNGNPRFRVTPAVSPTADTQKVQYTALDDAGGTRASGSKTLLDGLAGRKVALLADMNAALWAAVADCTFPGQLDGGGWNGTSDFSVASATTSYKGFYNGGTEVATMYPA